MFRASSDYTVTYTQSKLETLTLETFNALDGFGTR